MSKKPDHLQQYPTADEQEQSDCAKRTMVGRGERKAPQYGRFWPGMNSRDETDPVTMKPVGRMLSEGFEMMDDNDVAD